LERPNENHGTWKGGGKKHTRPSKKDQQLVPPPIVPKQRKNMNVERLMRAKNRKLVMGVKKPFRTGKNWAASVGWRKKGDEKTAIKKRGTETSYGKEKADPGLKMEPFTTGFGETFK